MRPRARLLRGADRDDDGASTAGRFCLGWTVIAGTLHITGCLATVDGLAEIPAAERGIVRALWRVGLTWGTRPQTC